MGISFTVPSGWLAKRQGFNGPSKAIHLPGGGLNLLMIEQPRQGTFGNTITLYAAPATDATGSAKDFVAHAVQTQVTRSPQTSELVRDTFPVDYAGKHFFRADCKTSKPRAALRSMIFTRFRDYYIGEMVEAGSPAELDSAVDSLRISLSAKMCAIPSALPGRRFGRRRDRTANIACVCVRPVQRIAEILSRLPMYFIEVIKGEGFGEAGWLGGRLRYPPAEDLASG